MTAWPPAHHDALQIMIEIEHMSASEAAFALNEVFHARYTRNAVISRCKRKGIQLANGKGGRLGPKGGPSQQKPRQRAVTPAQRPDVAMRKDAAPPKTPAPFTPRTVEVHTGNMPLLELAPDGCRWPIGGWPDDTPVTFCNHRQLPSLPYCAPHQRLAIGEPAARRVQGYWPR